MNIKLIKPKDAAEILMCSERTLEAWRREEKGPNYYKLSLIHISEPTRPY